MSDVFRFFQIRPPLKTAVRETVARGVATRPVLSVASASSSMRSGMGHPLLLALSGTPLAPTQSGGSAASAFYNDLRAAYDAQDIDGFIRVASNHYLNSAIRTLSDVSPLGRDAYTLFEEMGPLIEKAAVDQFISQHAQPDIVTYLQQDASGEVERAKDTILSMEALRLHGSHQGVMPTRLLKALYGLTIAHELRARDPDNWSVAPLTKLFEMPIYVPGWVWNIDPCRWPIRKAPPGVGNGAPQEDLTDLAASALIQKRQAIALYSTALERPPKEDLCNCTCDDRCVPQSPCCAKIKSFIADLLIVRETLRCYVPADIAYIENVLACEKRTRKHDSLLQFEQTQVTETTVTTAQQLDHQVSERFELSSETQKTIESDSNIDAGVTINQRWGTGSATITASASFGTSTSTSEKTAQNYARDVVDRSVSTIQRSARQLVSRSMLSRTRESNTHVFDRSGQDLTVGIYAWVSKTLKAQVYSYGRRMIYEFVLPEPAALYKALLTKAFGLDEEFTEPPPVAPPPASQITTINYFGLADQYGVDEALPTPPDATKTVGASAQGDYGQPTNRLGMLNDFTGLKSQAITISVPTGYSATDITGTINPTWNDHLGALYSNAPPAPPPSIALHVGQFNLQWYQGSGGTSSHTLQNMEGQLQAVVEAMNVTNFTMQLVVTCNMKPEVLHPWQAAVHKLLVDAYEEQKAAYDAALAAFQATQGEKKIAMQDFIRNRDPFFNREVERTELKRLAISWLSCQFFDRYNAMKRRVEPCGLPQMNLQEAEAQGNVTRFWEQALDWNLMTYLFYSYFWSAKCAWPDKVAEDSGDGLFDKFMQAGAARVQVPVAEGFEDYMLYWENTGQIWGQEGEPPRSDTDPHWLSMVEEIKHQQDCYLNDREGRVDTSPPSSTITIKGSDRYWDPSLSAVDLNAIAMDIDRESAIDGVVYRIAAIALDPNSPSFDILSPNSMWWTLTLDRACEGAPASGLPYSIGAKFVGAPWMVTVPTNLIWLKNDTYCLPCYPLTCAGE